ncbi:MAG: LacI family DNA-binding transcriptional regulator [Chloroflexi bacterium]|nr:LacI family DNA-binding transcriptional regulator [Chloroflexota bacterium]
MSARRRPTIKEVAAAAGVSTQTVSRVINNRPDVAPETFERIQQIISETGYSPNMFARGLTQGRSHTLGVVAYGLEYFGPSRVLTGIEQQAAAVGYAISLNLIHEPEQADVEGLLASLVSRQVDGIIWAVPDVGDNRAWSNAAGSDHPVPVLLVGGMGGQSLLGSIGIDNRAIGRLATEHLLSGGARHVGLVTGPMDWWESRERQLGWRESLQERGLPASDRQIANGDWSATSGEAGLYQLVEQAPDLDAVFASNDQMALGVMHAAHRLGRRIPDELSVVGVDNIAEASHFWPALTTVDQPLRDAGGLAVRELDGAIRRARAARRGQDGAPAPRTLLQPKLVIRESSRPTP